MPDSNTFTIRVDPTQPAYVQRDDSQLKSDRIALPSRFRPRNLEADRLSEN